MNSRLKFDVMTDSELQHMKSRGEELLEKRGVMIDHVPLLQALAEKGCIVDFETKFCKFPKALIDQAVAAVPKEFTLYAPDPQFDMPYPHPEGKFYTRTCTGAPRYRSARGSTQDTHYVRPEELKEWYKLCNALENIDFIAFPSTSAEIFPAEAVDIYTLERVLNYSAKHIWIQPYEPDHVQYLCDLCAAAVGGYEELRRRSPVSMITCSVPGLRFKNLDGEIIYLSAKYGIPCQPCSLPTAGANTPVTGQANAFMACVEVLAQIIMLELLCPGLPVIATPLLFSMDMQTTYILQSATDITISRLIAMEYFERGYNIRAHSYGTGSDSLTLDAQNFIERTSLIHAMALSEASVLGGAGQLETAKTISPIQLIIDNEIFGIAQHIRMGLAVDDETLDWEELEEGIYEDPRYSFLMSPHTLDHFSEIHRPDMFCRESVVQWTRGGCKDLLDKALEKYDRIMAEPDTYALPEDKAAACAAVLKKAHDALCK